jgi:signal transduction histidine kinase
VLKGIRRSIESGGRMWSDEYRFQRKDGSYAFVFDKGFVVRDGRGNPSRMVGGICDVTEQRAADEKIRSSRQQLRALSAKLQLLREDEQKRIAREIHDELGQMLTALKMDLRWVENQLSNSLTIPEANPILDRVVAATQLTDNTIVAVQKIAAELRPGILDSLGLVAALKQEVRRFEERTGIQCQFTVVEPQPVLSALAVTTVFRTLQESLTNVVRHASASEVKIDFRAEASHAVLKIVDNGKGIEGAALVDPKSLGLLGMQERALLVGGEITFGQADGRGTAVHLRVPLLVATSEAPP